MLLISHCFPPDSSVGALRWEMMLRSAAERGWSADVILGDPAQAEMRDDSRLRQLPAGTRLFGVAVREQALESVERSVRRLASRQLEKRLRSVASSDPATLQHVEGAGRVSVREKLRELRRAYLARLFYRRWRQWADDAVTLAASLAKSVHYDCVVSSGPPHLAHHAAGRIATRLGIPAVMDFRDPWAIEPFDPVDLQGSTYRRLGLRLEADSLRQAALIVCNTNAAADMYRQAYPQFASRIMTVMNGADPDSRRPSSPERRFIITQAGSLVAGRDPRVLFRVVRQAVDELRPSPDEFVLHFMGDTHYEGKSLECIAREEGIADYFVAEPRRPRAEALALLERSSIVVVLPQLQDHCVPGKIFEYVQLNAWLLAIARRGIAIEALLRGSGVDVVDPADEEAMTATIVRRYRQFAAGERPAPANADGRFDRSRQAARFFDALDTLIASR
jgi:hypothetical protein